MTDTTQANNPAVPKRATRNALGEAAAQGAAAGPQAASPPEVGEHPLFDAAPTEDHIPLDDHISEPDAYEGVDETKRPLNFVREPFGEPRLKLQAPARSGFRRYWFNSDKPGRIDDALKAGYAFVKVNGRNVRSVVGRAKNGGAQIAYLMEIPDAWFVQDMRAQQNKVDTIDAAIMGGNIGSKPGQLTQDGDNRYIPKDGIRYNPGRTVPQA